MQQTRSKRYIPRAPSLGTKQNLIVAINFN